MSEVWPSDNAETEPFAPTHEDIRAFSMLCGICAACGKPAGDRGTICCYFEPDGQSHPHCLCPPCRFRLELGPPEADAVMAQILIRLLPARGSA